MKVIDIIKCKVRGTINLPRLIRDGLSVGKNFHVQEGVIIDPGHCWLIEIGDNVTLAPRVHILAHDASMYVHLGYARIGKVVIGNNCFLGAGTIVLPGVCIDDNTIVGAGSVVTKSLIGGGVYAGNPCKKIYEYDEWINREKINISNCPVYDESYRIGNITDDMKKEMKEQLSKFGYIV